LVGVPYRLPSYDSNAACQYCQDAYPKTGHDGPVRNFNATPMGYVKSPELVKKPHLVAR
jgi:hypothetical protein